MTQALADYVTPKRVDLLMYGVPVASAIVLHNLLNEGQYQGAIIHCCIGTAIYWVGKIFEKRHPDDVGSRNQRRFGQNFLAGCAAALIHRTIPMVPKITEFVSSYFFCSDKK